MATTIQILNALGVVDNEAKALELIISFNTQLYAYQTIGCFVQRAMGGTPDAPPRSFKMADNTESFNYENWRRSHEAGDTHLTEVVRVCASTNQIACIPNLLDYDEVLAELNAPPPPPRVRPTATHA